MFVPQNEQGVIVLFASMAKEAGWEFVEIRTKYPDAVLFRNGEQWKVEFEFLASNFLDHGHDHRECDMIVCWKNDYQDCPLPIVELSDPRSLVATHAKSNPLHKEIEYWKRRALRAESRAAVLQREVEIQKEGYRMSDGLLPQANEALSMQEDGMTISEIADLMQKSERTIYNYLKAAKKPVPYTNGHAAEAQ